MNEFERGAVFALELLKKQLTERSDTIRDATRSMTLDRDVGTMLHAADQLLTGVLIRFDTELMKQLVVEKKGQTK